MIPVELRRLNARKPPARRAGQAHRLALGWLGTPLDELPEEQDAVYDLRDRIAAGTGHPNEHLGEAQSIVIAKRTGSILISEDGGAREEAEVEKVRSVSIYGLLGLHLSSGKLTGPQADALVVDLEAGGRGLKGVELTIAWLKRTGHIRLP